MNIGFIGYGNMAQALAKGLIDAGKISGNQIYACAVHYDKLCKNAESLGINPMESALEVVEHSGCIVLAVKPNKIEEVVKLIKEHLKGKFIISIAAGYNFEKYEELFEKGTHHLSTIPNTPVAVQEGIMACENTHSLSKEELEPFTSIFGSIALLEWVDTAQLSIAGTIAGCTPAFTAMYLEALGDAGVKHGLARQSAYRLVAKMLCGTGKLYLENEEHPGAMKDAVCSPGGTTIRGVASLEKNGFRGSVIEAIDAIENK